ncbi:hypothetical protein [Klebsiella phage phiKp_21]|uniref:Uncharacterized protein n=1 Tax=Klebsiella phage vB_KleM_RaK2 TaxID=1147094 RepID=H6X3Z0_9CAUD|nr:hypothetical protein F403_gp352 [Klebsiella phage vB_KleM_RaK2]YP_010843110.1 hypothetical protein ACQ27_gp226 [Klebsiella phage K64-1]QOE32596.1 hypothetical protein CPT_Muenster_424 [Klebsiella phage Muenster]UYL05078.1 hypothetical protein DIDNDMLP_00087 [Klebsiella phage KP13-7]BEH88087.1 hypothetical protein [Klebsiella phage phiKp_21]AFA44456.1 hypothetical protein RaK2_00183 [Klebsiella phage vB_KleM_RaK2]
MSVLFEKKYCTKCLTAYTIQGMICCSNCQSTDAQTFLVDDRYTDLIQFKANRNLKHFSALHDKD